MQNTLAKLLNSYFRFFHWKLFLYSTSHMRTSNIDNIVQNKT